ncbi:MAG: uracil-DNA glycosylase family protein [Bacteroidia bacterium]|nr:uracil-DNA glycosylase family protein [Bacteroidia bacterium]
MKDEREKDERDFLTTQYREAIKNLYSERKIIPTIGEFLCERHPECESSAKVKLYTGNWAFVGDRYGHAKIEGISAKILFIAMDRGGHDGAANELFPGTQESFRTSIENPDNPHMGGVSLILKELVDEAPLKQLSGICALTNAIKCVKPTGMQTTHATQKMKTNCSIHLESEIQSLKPDIIITQGDHPRDTVLNLLKPNLIQQFHTTGSGKASLYITANNVIVLVTPHPARLSGMEWRNGKMPAYFYSAIAETRKKFIESVNKN